MFVNSTLRSCIELIISLKGLKISAQGNALRNCCAPVKALKGRNISPLLGFRPGQLNYIGRRPMLIYYALSYLFQNLF
jgi:hypothetical protein